jgi:hypothetical protein
MLLIPSNLTYLPIFVITKILILVVIVFVVITYDCLALVSGGTYSFIIKDKVILKERWGQKFEVGIMGE